MEQFPWILIGSSIRRVKTELPPIPPFLEKPPFLPTSSYQRSNITPITLLLFWSLAICFVFALSAFSKFFLLAGFGLIFFALTQMRSYFLKSKNEAPISDSYFKALEDYARKEAEYKTAIAITRSPEAVQEYQYQGLLKVLSRTKAEDGQQPDFVLTPIEQQFFEILNRYFPNKIYPKLFFNSTNLPTYILDFAYIDSALNLRIDIEIDEPYDVDTGKPTHYLRAFSDETWNEFLLSKGWIVMRFSVGQVMQEPTSCCKAIAQEIYNLLGDPAIIAAFDAVPDLQPLERWTERQAYRMAEEKRFI